MAKKDRGESAQDRAYQFIKRGITNLEFRPNQKLRAEDLSARLRMSRTPVREALGRLGQEGLVRRDNGWGYMVVPVTSSDAMKLFGVREALEVQVVREAIPKFQKSSLKVLGKLMSEAAGLLRANRIKEFREVNRRFHALITSEADNQFLKQMLSLIEDRIRIVGGLVMEKHRLRTNEVLADNIRIYRAIRKQDVAATVRAVRSHIRRARRDFFVYVQKDAVGK